MKKWLSLLVSVAVAFSLTGCIDSGDKETSTQKTDVSIYPDRPIEMVIPFGEGGASDIFSRKFAKLMSSKLSQPVHPVNKKGSGGLVGMLYASLQPNDGYTILEVTPSHIISDVLEKSPEVKLMHSFEPLARIQSDIYVLSVLKNGKFKSFQEMVEYGQKNEITFAGISPGGLDDMTLVSLAESTNMKIRFNPYKSGAEVKEAVLDGEVDIYLDKIISAIDFIKNGSIKPLVILNDKRVVHIPELASVPATTDFGYNVTIGSWRGFVIKKGTPLHIKNKLIHTLEEVYDSVEYQKFAEENLANIRPGFLDAKDFKAQWEEEYIVFDAIAKKVGLK